MAEPPDQMPAAAGRGDLRASHADREQVIGTLKGAFVRGWLGKDEFDLRVGQVLVSRTYAELAAVTADLPAALTADPPHEPARAPGGRPVLPRPGLVGTVATVLYAGMWPLAFVLPRNSDGYPRYGVSLVGSATLVFMLVVTLIAVWAQVRGSRQEKQSGGQLPGRPAPGAGGQASWRVTSAGPGGQAPPVDPGHRHTAEAARQRRPRPPVPVRGYHAGGGLAAGPARG